ncbi:hypothetical protein L2E82_13575 [Cichorium intybus]|uniref:Uncharacterized protein n=1 Tax=Cichorium intybus TaxID=13427 RepID=A0ACB9EXQ2_CICIN|nr:hypothetical protein L2E82_13575 [Cichorium intybus]
MARRPLPSFSKILLDPSDPHLPLPHAFVRKYLENKIPENPILRSVNGGYSWRLTIKKLGENYCFVNGWNTVVNDSHLEFGDFLVFWLVDPSTFKLSIFSPSGCEKDFPVEIDDANEEEEEYEEAVKVEDEEDEEEEEDEDELDEDEYDEEEEEEEEFEEEEEEEEDDDIFADGGSHGGGDEEEDDVDEDSGDVDVDVDGDDGDPFFMTIISKGHISKGHMRLPTEFARLVGIDSERSVTMKNLDGDEWEINLRSEIKHYTPIKHYTRYYFSTGWSGFWRANELSEGDQCIFKYIRSEDKLCLAKVTKKRRVQARQPASKPPATEVLKSKPRVKPPSVEVESKDGGREVVKKKLRPTQPAAEVLKRSRRQPPRMEVVKKKVGPKHPAGKVLVAEVSKSPRGRPPNVKVRSKRQAGKAPAAEVSKRSSLRSQAVEKKARNKKPAGKAPAAEVLQRKRGRPSRVEMESKDDGAKVVKRPPGRPSKRRK